jgi:predicted amidohydrolase YtcJ
VPSKDDLDEVIPDRPVFLSNRDHHGAWVNSRALALAGVDAGTPDPPDGRIERTAAGEPQGTLHEGAMNLLHRVAPAVTLDEQVAGILEGQRYLHSLASPPGRRRSSASTRWFPTASTPTARSTAGAC